MYARDAVARMLDVTAQNNRDQMMKSHLQNVAPNPSSQEGWFQGLISEHCPSQFVSWNWRKHCRVIRKFATELISHFTQGVHTGFQGVRTPRFSKNLPTASVKRRLFPPIWQTKFRLAAWLVLSIIHLFWIFKFLRLVWSPKRTEINFAQSFINHVLNPAQPALLVTFQKRNLIFSISQLMML